ncbi:DUF938 domain-containing protein [Croceicoccus bisphenolivorans]|uniref:DUF938 domain-containing protein n=1 Tax=Croceicoccus bisphenolivorans TaxID=1783232 RepID=UPI00082CD31F|nr:DUF938 domain-containing protein [Croceicoccus bisphenolivorans]
MSDAGSDPQPFELAASAERQHAPATLRNREPIAEQLRTILPDRGLILEIASGSGEHAVYLAGQFPTLDWRPTDMSDAALASIAAWRAENGRSNVLPPLRLDLTDTDWPVGQADAIFCANMTHIAPWEATEGLFGGAGRVLARGCPMVIYGPFIEADVPTSPSNLAFDENLKARNRLWGLRDVAALDDLALANGLSRQARVAMPANNLLLVYRRK